MSLRALLPLAVLAVTLVACGGPEQGIVTEKSFESAYTTTMLLPISCGNGCTSLMPIIETVPECWRMALYDSGGTGSICVDQATYDATPVGSRYRGEAS